MEPQLEPTEATDAPAAGPAVVDGELAAQVAAWHNRHPLALRIRPAQVQGMGIVALPVRAGSGAAARRVKPAFTDDVFAPITARQAAAFAARQGVKERPDITPLREVAAAGADAAAAQPMYLRTAAIEAPGRRVRVLVAAGDPGRSRLAVLGPRLWSLQRTVVAAALGGAGGTALLAGVVATLWLWRAAPQAPAPEPATAATAASAPATATAASAPATDSAAAATASAELAASGPEREQAGSSTAVAAAGLSAARAGDASSASSAPAASVASRDLPASAAAAVAIAPARAASVALPAASAPAVAAVDAKAALADIRPRLTDEQRAEARRIGRQIREQDAPQATAAAAPLVAGGRHFALVTRTTRGRPAAQLMQSLMASAAAGAALPGQARTEVMQVKEGFRAIWWPFASPADAEAARSALTAYGIKAELVEF
jgi:hypothetical protein